MHKSFYWIPSIYGVKVHHIWNHWKRDILLQQKTWSSDEPFLLMNSLAVTLVVSLLILSIMKLGKSFISYQSWVSLLLTTWHQGLHLIRNTVIVLRLRRHFLNTRRMRVQLSTETDSCWFNISARSTIKSPLTTVWLSAVLK